MGFELAAGIVGLTLAGYWIDHHFGVGPWGLIVGAGLGLVGSLYNFIRQSLEMMKTDAAARRKKQLERRDASDRPD
jgi:F0F1-type ATP synthase assembly protein I